MFLYCKLEQPLPITQVLDYLVLKKGVLDGAASLAALASLGKQHLVTYSCYTCELELDVVRKSIELWSTG